MKVRSLGVFDLSVNKNLKDFFDSSKKNPAMKAIADGYETRLWPTHDGDGLKAHGLGGRKFLYGHFKNLNSLSGLDFDFKQANSQQVLAP